MREKTHLALVLSLALATVLQAGPAIAAPPATHESILDRHHLLYGTVIPNPTDSPHGTPSELHVCLSCHAVDSSSGFDRFLVETDCRACHSLERHHVLYNTAALPLTEAPHGAPGEPYGCFSCHDLDTRSGTNQILVERDCRVCHQPSGAVTVVVDIKPGTRRNRMNLRSKWLLPISIRGSHNYDVTEIDVSSLLLAGEVEPLQWRFKKSAGGFTDLKLKFSSEEVRDALGNLQPGQTYEVWITGKFKNGTRIMGGDSILAVGRPSRKHSSEIRPSSEGGVR